MAMPHFQGRRVLSLESRRAAEDATLISKYGGRPVVAPALRELPLESNTAAVDFAAALLLGDIDIGIFLTGVGVRAIVDVFAQAHPGEEIRQALSRIKVAVRGPKPAAVFRELNVPDLGHRAGAEHLARAARVHRGARRTRCRWRVHASPCRSTACPISS